MFKYSGVSAFIVSDAAQGENRHQRKILEQVWDVNGSYVNDNTLTVTMKRLRDKLSQPTCLKTIRSVGYRMEDTL